MTSRTHLLAKSSNCFTLNLHEAEFTLCLNYLVAHVRFAANERNSDDVRSHIYLVVIHTSEVGYKLQIAHFGRQGESGRQIYQRSCVVRQIYSVFIRRANHVYLLSCLFDGIASMQNSAGSRYMRPANTFVAMSIKRWIRNENHKSVHSVWTCCQMLRSIPIWRHRISASRWYLWWRCRTSSPIAVRFRL